MAAQLRCGLYQKGSRSRPYRSRQDARGSGGAVRTDGGRGTRHLLRAVRAAPPAKDVDWTQLGFSVKNVAPTMFLARYSGDKGWDTGSLQPYAPLALDPAAQVLNYGQSIFEGMKAQRTAKDDIVLFRPRDNAARMRAGAERLVMPPPPEALFLRAVEGVVRENAHMVPPMGLGSLYLRPLLLGTGPIVGLGPAPEFTFLVFGTAVGGYFKGGQKALRLYVETEMHRAGPGGMGGTKAAGNYSPVLVRQMAAKAENFDDVLFLDAVQCRMLEEVASSNLFIVKDGVIKTPALAGTILPGITRDSVIAQLQYKGFRVLETDVSIDEACAADEIFTAGTAVGVSPVGLLQYKGTDYVYDAPGPITTSINDDLTRIQSARAEDLHGWVHKVC